MRIVIRFIILLLPSFNFCCLAGLVSMDDADPDFSAMLTSYEGSMMQATARARMSCFGTGAGADGVA